MVRPRKAEQIDIRNRAIDVTARLSVERGVDRVTLQDIAAEVGCRAPALYRYFPSKEALLLEVHNEGFRRLYAHKLAAAAASGADAFERLRQGGLAYVRFALENPNLYELMFHERGPYRHLTALRNAGAPEGRDFAIRSLEFLRASVEACQQEGYLRGLDPDSAAFTFWSVVHGAVSLALRRRMPFHQIDAEEMVARAVEVMMALVQASRPADPAHPPRPPMR